MTPRHAVRRPRLSALLAAAALNSAFLSPATAAKSVLDPDDPLPRRGAAPLEEIPWVATEYGSVETGDGARLRTLVTRPEGSTGALHPVLFTQWVSCGSIEYEAGSNSSEINAAIARETGLALIRVERAGAGDSEGPACSELDYDTEVRHYIDAYKSILASGGVDASKVFVYGASLGSTTAPLVAKALQDEGYNIAGVAVQGGGALTYFERMLFFDRYYLERRPDAVPRDAIHETMVDHILFQTEYLLKGRHPDEIARDNPAMAKVRGEVRGLGETVHYGRPFAWHQQAAQRDFLAAWSTIDAPVLVIFNEFEQFENRRGAAVIVETVNMRRPGTATLIERKGVGHSNNRFPNIYDAYVGKNGAPAWEGTARALVDWFKRQSSAD